jgi:phosphatidylserine/phosphatidylglycerophosphate/cardiolipin synthase-like enzyme
MKTRLTILTLSIAILLASCIYLPSQTDTGTLKQQPVQAQVGINSTGEINQPNAQVYFPRRGDKPELALQALYLSTQSNLDIAIYSLTHPIIVKAIGDAYKRGVKVRIITDKTQAAGATQKHAMNDLITIGIPIKIDAHSGLMHLKLSIIDGKIATIGSYNYSKGASEDNDEVLMVINETWFALLCQSEFDRLWNSPQFTDLGLSY